MRFPILVLVPDYGAWARPGLEMVEWYISEEDFTDVYTRTLKRRQHNAMLVVDVTGQCWKVLKAEGVGIPGTGWYRVANTIFRDKRLVRYEVEKSELLPFEEIRRRACESIQTHPDRYRDDEAIAGESGPPRDEQEMLDELTDKARAALDMRGLIDVFQDWQMDGG